MNDRNLRQMTIDALRAAANALEAGQDIADVEITPMITGSQIDSDEFDTLEEAEQTAQRELGDERDEGVFSDSIDQLSWGVFVAVECVRVKVLTDPASVEQAKDRGFDEMWEVTMNPAWPASENDSSDGYYSHPDGCYSNDPSAVRDCHSDGHYVCGICTRLDKLDR